MSSNDEPLEHAEARVAHVLEEELERVESFEVARAVVERVEHLSAGHTEAECAQQAAERTDQPGEAARSIEQAAQQPDAVAAIAEALTTTGAHTVAPTPAAPTVLEGAQATLHPEAAVSPRAARGRRLLKEAMLRRMGPLPGLDARLYLAINEGPHPGWLDSCMWILALVTLGGWIWVIGTLLAYLLRVPRSWLAFVRLLPCVVGATWLVEGPIKTLFKRRRPFVRIVEALVIGKKPGSWSFPSGHTASSFAGAWALSSVWPRQAPLFFGLAAMVGFSRVYVGAHYPGDVASGALFGTLLSELIRRSVARLLARL